MHHRHMRRHLSVAVAVLLASCATAPRQDTPEIPEIVETPRTARSGLAGLTAGELVGHFGNPALQIREGTSLKLQFRGRTCVLDAYLYPSQGDNTPRVTHIDTRTTNGVDVDQAACISALENPS
jgi:hypothetical protein